jgi:thymidine kinase
MMALADDFQEIKQLCHCGRKATMILKFDPNGEAVRSGPVIEIGGESRYVSVCRPHWTKGDIGPAARQLLAEAVVAAE